VIAVVTTSDSRSRKPVARTRPNARNRVHNRCHTPRALFCTGTRQAGNYTLQVRFWQADPQAFRFSIKPEDPMTCEALAPATVGKSWDVPATSGAYAKRHRCDLQ